MKPTLITLILSAAAMAVGLSTRQMVHADISGHMRYYGTAILTISGVLIVICLWRLIRLRHSRPLPRGDAPPKASRHDRRRYRLRFDGPHYPLFIQKTAETHPVLEFSCPVHDISETGISLGCVGVYAHGQTVLGEIIFESGRGAPINGRVVREEVDRTCLLLDCTIDPPLLMAEQREQILKQKNKGPWPPVSGNVLEKTAVPLPSHAPKGICRIKRN
ncbi:MAG: hypothetical protein WBY88_14375 [Desulfosarcina sp.]